MYKRILLILLFVFWELIALGKVRDNTTGLRKYNGSGDLTESLPQKGPYLSCVTQNSIIVSWRTATLDSSVVQYGLTTVYTHEEKDLTLKTAHSLTLTDLFLTLSIIIEFFLKGAKLRIMLSGLPFLLIPHLSFVFMVIPEPNPIAIWRW